MSTATRTDASAIIELRNPAAVGWRTIVAGDTELEVAWPRHSTYLLMGLRTLPDGRWQGCRMDDTRWGVDGTLADAEAKARQFLGESVEYYEDSSAALDQVTQ